MLRSKKGTTVTIEDPMINQNALIGFTPKELFLEINRKIDVMTDLIQSKVDHPDFSVLENKVSDMERHGCDTAKKNTVELAALRVEISNVNKAVAELTKVTATTAALTEFKNSMDTIKRATTMQWIGIIISAALGLIGIYMRMK